MVAKFLDLNKPSYDKYDIVHDCNHEQNGSLYFSSIVLQCKWPSLSRRIVGIQKFCHHGNVTSGFSFLLGYFWMIHTHTPVFLCIGGINNLLFLVYLQFILCNLTSSSKSYRQHVRHSTTAHAPKIKPKDHNQTMIRTSKNSCTRKFVYVECQNTKEKQIFSSQGLSAPCLAGRTVG